MLLTKKLIQSRLNNLDAEDADDALCGYCNKEIPKRNFEKDCWYVESLTIPPKFESSNKDHKYGITLAFHKACGEEAFANMIGLYVEDDDDDDDEY